MNRISDIAQTLSLLSVSDLVSLNKIRVGNRNDGGYLMANALRSEQLVLSYGLSWNIEYEMHLANLGHTIHMFDHTIEGLSAHHKNFNFHREGVASEKSSDGLLDTIKSHLKRYSEDKSDLILKIDVEGAEWDTFDWIDKADLCRFEQIVIEFHDFSRISDDAWRQRATRVLSILQRYFHLIHVHANNCAPIVVVNGLSVADVIEVSYVRRDRFEAQRSELSLPMSLDAPNNPILPDLPLWFFPYPQYSNVSMIDREAKRLDEQHELSVYRHQKNQYIAESNKVVSDDLINRSIIDQGSLSSMKILLISVHPVLEYDDICMLEDAGHIVFSLGFYFHRIPTEDIRPALELTDWHKETADKLSSYGVESYVDGNRHLKVDKNVIEMFDLVVVHYDIKFIRENWPSLCTVPVIWRAIGQENGDIEQEISEYRRLGLKVVRWSPIQRYLPRYAGADAFIRASKSSDDWSGWTGTENTIVTFNNDFLMRRHGLSYDFWKDSVAGFNVELFGLRNDDIPEWKGVLSYEDQRAKLRSARVAFITGTRPAPYTLGLIEAWMTGIPVVHIDPAVVGDLQAGTAEIGELIRHGEDGFVVQNVEQARQVLSDLLNDYDLANRISSAGRASAIRIFGRKEIQRQWSAFFQSSLL